ncbi:MAG: phosphohistidine phosphatase SixA [Arenicellales bacterium]
MKLYLVQHGKALAKDVDPDRPLSGEGRAEVGKLVEFLAGRIQVSRVLHSGKTRAQQTAEKLTAIMAGGLPVETISGIGPNDSVEDFAVRVMNGDEDLLVVGHLPFMARLVSLLVSGSADADIVSYSPGSIVFLESLNHGHFQVQWMVRPGLLRSR